jgi:hypothetical protein
MRHIGKNPGPATPVHLSDWRHNHEGFTPYPCRQPVRTTKPLLSNFKQTINRNEVSYSAESIFTAFLSSYEKQRDHLKQPWSMRQAWAAE